MQSAHLRLTFNELVTEETFQQIHMRSIKYLHSQIKMYKNVLSGSQIYAKKHLFKTSYRIKYIWALIKVNHCKEHFVGILLRISPGISKDCILIVSLSAKKTTDCELLFVNRSYYLCYQKTSYLTRQETFGSFSQELYIS